MISDVIFLMGPTGGGKTATVMDLYRLLPIDVINVDAAQIYRGLDIGTAKPSLAERRLVPHQLIDICDVSTIYSAASFCADARRAIEASFKRERIPVLVGGTSFYFRVLEQGLPPSPPADPKLRELLAARGQKEGWSVLHQELRVKDPGSAARIAPTDPQRIQRALEIIAMTGAPVAPPTSGRALPYPILKIALAPLDRTVLHTRIAQRFARMLARGLIDEAAWLYGCGLPEGAPATKLVGYRQVGEYLRDKITYNEMLAQGTAATRQLAKRQLTWLRADPTVRWCNSVHPDAARICADLIRQRIHTQGMS